MSVSAMLTLAPGCLPWRLRPAPAALRLPSRTVAEGPTSGARVAADLAPVPVPRCGWLRRSDLRVGGLNRRSHADERPLATW